MVMVRKTECKATGCECTGSINLVPPPPDLACGGHTPPPLSGQGIYLTLLTIKQ
jgi:hypothetical protein